MKNRGVAIVALSVIVIFGVIGCGKIEDIYFQTEYEVEHELKITSYYNPVLEVTVKGKADDLAVILFDPNGETRVSRISKEEMIDNIETVELPILSPELGTYSLVVKTITPEKVVYKKEIKFREGRVTIENVEIKFKPWYHGKQQIEQIELLVKNEGSLPVVFDKLLMEMAGQEGEASLLQRTVLPGENKITAGLVIFTRKKIEQYTPGSLQLPDLGGSFDEGTYLLTGRLYFANQKEKFITFEKEVRVPRSPY